MSISRQEPFKEMLYWPHRTAYAKTVTVYDYWRANGQSVRTSEGNIVSDYLYPLSYKQQIEELRLRAAQLQDDCLSLREAARKELQA